MFPKIPFVVVQQLPQHLRVEDVDTHAGEIPLLLVHGGAQFIQRGRVAGLFHEARDLLGIVHLHDAEAAGLMALHRLGRDRHIRARGHVLLDHVGDVHAVQLIAGEDHDQLRILVHEVAEILPNRVGRSLEPRLRNHRLHGGQDLHIPLRKLVEAVRALNVPVQGNAVELREQEDLADPAVDAVADRNIDQAILARDRHGGLCPVAGQRQQPLPLSTAHDYANDFHNRTVLRSDSVAASIS